MALRDAARLVGPFRALAIAYIVIGILFVFPRITDDGVAYFAETRSLLLDGDLDLANEYAVDVDRYSPGGEAGPRAVVPRDPDGTFQHQVNLGIVVLQGPFLVLGHIASATVNFVSRLFGGDAVFSMDGFALPYVLAVSFGANALVAGGLAILATFLSPFVGRWPAIGGALAVWLGSMLFFWSTQRPAHAHAPLIFVECLFVVLFLSRGRQLRDWVAWFVLGALWGLLVTTRPVTVLYAVVPLGYLVAAGIVPAVRLWGAHSTSTVASFRAALTVAGTAAVAGLAFLAGSFLGRVPQIAFGHDLSLLGSGYYEETGYLTRANLGAPVAGLSSLLFDPMQGLLWWSPVVVLGIVGLLAFWRRGRLIGISAVVWGGAAWAFVGLLDEPARFGGFDAASRHLVDATPVYVIGVAGLLGLARQLLRGRRREEAREATEPREVAARWWRGSPRGRTALGVTIVATVVAAVAWSMLAQVAGSIAPVGGLPPWERVATIVGDPTILGRLWYTPATGLAAEGRVFLGGQVAQGVLNADLRAVGAAVAGTAWLLIVGAIPLIGGEWAFRQARRRRFVTPRPGWRRPPFQVRAVRRVTVWLPWLVMVAFLTALALPALMPPGGIRNGARITFRTWDGRTTARPPGTVTGIRFGQSPQGNAIVVPPRPAPPDVTSSLDTISRGTFVDIGAGRDVLVPAPFGWDVVTHVTLWFGPTFDRAAAVNVSVAWADNPTPARRVTLGAEQLALGVVPVPVPIHVAGQAGAMLLIRVEPVAGAPAPQVSVHGSTLAFQLSGLQSRFIPFMLIDDVVFAPSLADLTLPENASVEFGEAGGRMRIGPWGPEQLLRWSTSSGWLLPGPTTVPGSWGESTARSPAAGPLVVVLDAPAPISAFDASMLVTSYGDSPGGAATIEISTDGLTFRPLASMTPDVARRQGRVSGSADLAAPVSRIWLRLDADPSTGVIGINAAWFDLELDVPQGTVGSFQTRDIAIEGDRPGDPGVATIEVTAAGPTGIRLLAIRALSAVPRTIVRVAGPAGVVLATFGLAAAALIVRRRSRVAALGLVAWAGIGLLCATTLAPRVILVPSALAFDQGTGEGLTIGRERVDSNAPDTEYLSPLVSLPRGSLARIHHIDGDGVAEARIRELGTDGSSGPWQPHEVLLDRHGGAQVGIPFHNPGSRLDEIEIDAAPWTGR